MEKIKHNLDTSKVRPSYQTDQPDVKVRTVHEITNRPTTTVTIIELID